jgi:hypothetical protein
MVIRRLHARPGWSTSRPGETPFWRPCRSTGPRPRASCSRLGHGSMIRSSLGWWTWCGRGCQPRIWPGDRSCIRSCSRARAASPVPWRCQPLPATSWRHTRPRCSRPTPASGAAIWPASAPRMSGIPSGGMAGESVRRGGASSSGAQSPRVGASCDTPGTHSAEGVHPGGAAPRLGPRAQHKLSPPRKRLPRRAVGGRASKLKGTMKMTPTNPGVLWRSRPARP